jgi:hypothetical protein
MRRTEGMRVPKPPMRMNAAFGATEVMPFCKAARAQEAAEMPELRWSSFPEDF